ncbi:hypothetical protein BUALT_Bualt07G0066900 [Buddleja alternifolia]|uniref:Transposase n=1 Tax=Buddleja alternifolia TaxID=168488 RepID=A0AAV6XJM0_9LAMI|nr:hypothetical protein BUALT_Bualt07G0066900 [Buddleja alternifolia]
MKENILEWNLDKKIFSVVVDNASSNDSMMRKLREWLLKDSLIPLNGDLLHLRCSAHVLNLIVQDGLSPIRGLIEKIRETVRYLNKSPSATQKFDTALRHCNLEGKRKVAMDVPKLETALPLKEAFCRLQRIDGHYQFSPSESEWEVAKIVHDCLKYFYEATHHFNGSKYPTSNVFFLDILFDSCFSSDVLDEGEYRKNMAGIVTDLRDLYRDAEFMVLNFKQGERRSQFYDVLSHYDMTVMD